MHYHRYFGTGPIPVIEFPFGFFIGRRGQPTWKLYTMSSSSEDVEGLEEESSCPSEWSDDAEGSYMYDQEKSVQNEEREIHGCARGEQTTEVTSRRKLERRRKRKRDNRTSDEEETDQDEDAEKYRGAEPKVASRGKQERRRKRERVAAEDRASPDEEETDQEEDDRTSWSNLEKHRRDKEMTQRDEGERNERRKKLGQSVRGERQSSETVAGIVYLSRVPPFMKPHKVKHLLSLYGSVGRVYLKPEGMSVHFSIPQYPIPSFSNYVAHFATL